MLIIQIKVFSFIYCLARTKVFNLKTKVVIPQIKRQLVVINDQVNALVAKGKEQEALVFFTNSITDLKITNNTKE